MVALPVETRKSLIGQGIVPAPPFCLQQNGRARGRVHLPPFLDFVERAKTAHAEIVLIKTADVDARRGGGFLARVHRVSGVL